jgi:hypothetical protein
MRTNMAGYVWTVKRKGTNRVVRIDHHFVSGRATITFDGEIVYQRQRKLFDTGLTCRFHRDGVQYVVRMIAKPLGFQYEFEADDDVQRAMDWTGAWIVAVLVFVCIALVVFLGEFDNSYGSGFDGVGLLCFAAVGFVIFWMTFAGWRTRVLMALALMALYVGSYAWFSALGGYYFSQSGRLRWKGIGLSVSDVVIWHPKFVQWQPFLNIYGEHTHRATLLGWFYSPLIVADRGWVHPTEELFDRSEPGNVGRQELA